MRRLPQYVTCPATFTYQGAVSTQINLKFELREDGYHPVGTSVFLRDPVDTVRLETPDGCVTKPFTADRGGWAFWSSQEGDEWEPCSQGSANPADNKKEA